MRIAPSNITSLKPNEVFVFGSNEAGRHGAGAALFAKQKFGAKYGVGVGWTSPQSYGIPTKDKNIRTLPIETVSHYVGLFIQDAKSNPDKTFLVTEIGCGYAGYRPADIAPLFKECVELENVYLPESFWKILQKNS